MTKFEDLELNEYFMVKVVKFRTDKEYLKRAFEEGKTYEMRTSVYTHDDNYNWTTNFICFHKNGGFTQINEFDAELEITKKVF